MEIKDNQTFDFLKTRVSELEKENEDLRTLSRQLQLDKTKPNFIADLSIKKIAEDHNYRLLFKNITNGFALHEIICDNNNNPVNYRYLDANPAFEKLTGLPVNQIIGKTVLEVLPDLEPEWIKTYGKVALTGKPYRFESFAEPLNRYYEVLAFTPGQNLFAVLFNDITERRLLEKKMLKTMVQTEEIEREKFASNLHDEIGPILSSLNLYITTLAESDDKNKKAYILPQMQGLIREAITTVRDLGNDLSPHALLNNSLGKAIKSHLELCRELVPVIYRTNLKNRRFHHNIELVFYRVMKELLNNTIKHAQATKVTINLSFEGCLLKMKYTDNGIGFNKDMIMKNSTGMGMLNIFSRAKTINAEYLIDTQPDNGFNFEIWTHILD